MQGLTFRNLSILVVQDHEFLNSTMRLCLETLGFGKIATVTEGGDAFDTFRIMSPDFVLTDWNLQDMRGLELIEMIRRHPMSPNRLVPIIMITGYSSMERVQLAADAGVNSYIVKPFDVEKLVENIEHIINFPADFMESEAYCGPVRGGQSQSPFQKEIIEKRPLSKKIRKIETI